MHHEDLNVGFLSTLL